MQKPWQNYIQTQQANLQDNNKVIDFGNAELERQQVLAGDNIITDLSWLAIIKITGEDASTFLQGQFTNDVRLVTPNQFQISAWCSAKGRVLFSFYLFKRDDAYYILLDHAHLNAILQRLTMYKLRSKVDITDMSEHMLRIGLAGEKSTDLLNANSLKNVYDSLTENEMTILRIHGQQPRYIVLTENLEKMQNIWENSITTAQKVGQSAWELLDILAAVPRITPATSEAFVPQMINFQALEGIHFKKGCYTGQEVVARMQYLGTLKRRMYLAKIDSDTMPQMGDDLFVDNDTQSAGKIVNVQSHPEGGYILLAVIKIAQAETQPIHLQSQTGAVLTFLDLPYDVTIKD